jgi:cytochrome P450
MPWRPFDKSIKQNPYPHYAGQVKIATTFKAPGNVIYVLDHKTVKEVLSASVPFSSKEHKQPARFTLDTFSRLMEHCLFLQDGAEHHQNRYIASSAFSLTGIQTFVTHKVNTLMEALKTKKEFDLIQELAVPLTTHTLGHLLGFNEEGVEKAEYWSEALFKSVDIYADSPVILSMEEVATELEQYLKKLVQSGQVIKDSFISTCLNSFIKNGKSEEQAFVHLSSLIATILMTGIDTTVGAIGNSVHALLSNPEQWHNLRAQTDELMPTAINELLRYDTPVHFMFRIMSEDHVLNGVDIKKGQAVGACLASANRDPQVFDQSWRKLKLRQRSRQLLRQSHICNYLLSFLSIKTTIS